MHCRANAASVVDARDFCGLLYSFLECGGGDFGKLNCCFEELDLEEKAMNNEKTEAWKRSKKRELMDRIKNLADKIISVSMDMQQYGPKLQRRGFRTEYVYRRGEHRMLYENARKSLIATRKKIYKLQEELNKL